MTKRSLLLFLFHIVSTIVYFIGASIILTAVAFVISIFSFGGGGEFLATPVGITVVYGSLSFVAYMIIGGAFLGFEEYHHPSKDKPSHWSERLRTNNPLHYKKAQKQCLPYIIIALVLVVVQAVFWHAIYDPIFEGLQNKYSTKETHDTLVTLTQVIYGLLACYWGITLASTMRVPMMCKFFACPNCGKLCCYEYAGDAGQEITTTTKQKVGKESGYVYESHTTVTTTPKCHIRCHYCGQTKTVTDRHRNTKVEKKD